ncbi:hypothetical protein F3Y22_tig00110332pilonHSYRG00985 [Hibiscus syriacus]|uniref:Uncharacterized protein n=1 Tax=Hibiscus syriacus TaxID=106335 RepID=A0A6A3AWJ7_HIBSY|nr:hypothetical protein F3Y22_tig00110332pilonHSYRG00985 [Hibiscus syriacus]
MTQSMTSDAEIGKSGSGTLLLLLYMIRCLMAKRILWKFQAAKKLRSRTKKRTLDPTQQGSPRKQKTLESFLMKRCNDMDDPEDQSKLKYPWKM